MKTSQLSAASYSSNGYSVSITVSPNALSPGGTSTVTATSNVDVGTTAYYIQIYNDGTGNRVSFCGSGTTCSGTVSEASATTDYFTAYVASYSYTEPPPNIQASSDQVSVTWLSVSLSADPTLVGLGGSSTLTAYANADVGPTPYFIEIYDQTSGAFLAECGSGDTCSTSVRQQVRVVKRYVAYVSSYSTSNNPPPNIQVTSAASEVQWKDNPPQAIELTQFAGSDQAHTIHQFSPPDTQIGVSPTQVVEIVNDVLTVYDKHGNSLTSNPIDLYAMYGVNFNATSGYNRVGDPRIQYDSASGRFFAAELLFNSTDSTQSQVDVAVSPPPSGGATTSDALGTWTVTKVRSSDGTGILFDQPRLGVNTDKVTLTWEYGTNGPRCSSGCGEDLEVLDKADLLLAAPPSVYYVTDLLACKPPFAYCVRDGTESGIVPANSVTPTTTEYTAYNSKDFTNNSSLLIQAITGVPSQGNVHIAQTSLSIPRTQGPPHARQPGTSQTLDTGDDRVRSVVWRDNLLWAVGNDDCTPPAESTERSCLRVDAVSTSGSSAALISDYDYSSAGLDLYYPAVVTDGSGDVYIGYSESSSTLPVTAAVYAIPINSAYGQSYKYEDTSLSFRHGGGPYTESPNRWGDYSGIAVDPSNVNAVWVAEEYVPATNGATNWGTAVGEFQTAHSVDWRNDAPSSNPGARAAMGTAYDPIRKQVVLFGGCQRDSVCPANDTWTYDGTNWTLQHPATSPPVRIYPMMTWDPQIDQVVLFGGSGASSFLNDTWAWNGTNWTQLTPTGILPSARYESGFTADQTDVAADSKGNLVLFGGYTGSGQLNETWTYDRNKWNQEFPAHAPTYRAGLQLSFDPNSQQTVLFGGNEFSCPDHSCSGNPGNDTWTWDGTDWTHQTPANAPSARAFYQMTYDETVAGVAVFGGQNPTSGITDDTWVWNGQNWLQRAPTQTPPARDTTEMVYDNSSRRTILFSGIGGGGAIADTWSYGPS